MPINHRLISILDILSNISRCIFLNFLELQKCEEYVLLHIYEWGIDQQDNQGANENSKKSNIVCNQIVKENARKGLCLQITNKRTSYNICIHLWKKTMYIHEDMSIFFEKFKKILAYFLFMACSAFSSNLTTISENLTKCRRNNIGQLEC